MAGDVLLEKSQEGTVLQRLKPDSSSSDCGTAKQLTEEGRPATENHPSAAKAGYILHGLRHG
jgi:hypothetical protein